ncbi:hypothetical protein SETIT_5G255800v2 [Setaria italica]|uniref:Uncharacterized protein n=1 Tax=Setaria italica TaxID=4555 RepID=A0A368R8P8_SETIT|nr:hypothetical protein SETIT_5G255800v2 [Setaria italica]
MEMCSGDNNIHSWPVAGEHSFHIEGMLSLHYL